MCGPDSSSPTGSAGAHTPSGHRYYLRVGDVGYLPGSGLHLQLFGLFWGILITAGLLVAGLNLPKEAAGWTAAFIGVQCVLNALFDLRTLFTLSVSSFTPTDAMEWPA